MLVNKKEAVLTEKQLQAIDLLVGRTDQPMTKKQIAEEVGVSSVTLYAWLKKPEFNAELVKQAKTVTDYGLATAMSWATQAIENPKEKSSTKVKILELLMKNHSMLKDVQEATVTVDQSDTVKELMHSYGIKLTEK